MELLVKYIEAVSTFVDQHALARAALCAIVFMAAVQVCGLVHLDAHINVTHTASHSPDTNIADTNPVRTRRHDYVFKCNLRATKFSPVPELAG